MKPLFLLVVLAALPLAQTQVQPPAQDTVERTLTFATGSGPTRLVVDNVNGSIRVTGGGADNQVRVVARRTIKADSPDRADAARNEVTLDIEEGRTITLFVDGPFRGRDAARSRRRGTRHRGRTGYTVRYDFEITVPRQVDLELSTVNDGDILVERVGGQFDVENVNGGVELREIEGSGRAYALNEDLTVTFARNPSGNFYFGSLNGEVVVRLLPDLSADLRLKTFNGEIYTDFETSPLPTSSATVEQRGGKNVYKFTSSGVRIGRGGPTLEFDGFNGDIRILKKS